MLQFGGARLFRRTTLEGNLTDMSMYYNSVKSAQPLSFRPKAYLLFLIAARLPLLPNDVPVSRRSRPAKALVGTRDHVGDSGGGRWYASGFLSHMLDIFDIFAAF